VSKPQSDHCGVDSGFQEPHCFGVTQAVGGDVFAVQGRTGCASHVDVLGEAVFDSVGAEALAVTAGKERIGGLSWSFPEPVPKGENGVGGQRRGPLLASFAGTGDVGSSAEVDIASGKGDQLRNAKTALNRDQ
jgi:hypothetical protein